MSRPYLVRDGYFKDVDAAVITHVADTSPPVTVYPITL